MPEDRELVEEISKGSQAAMETLTRRYYKVIFAFVYRKVGNKETAYDLTQDIFIKMIQKIKTYSNKSKFKSWLFTIAVNHCRDYWRSADYKVTSKQSELPESLASKNNSVPYIFEKKETRERIKEALEELPENQKEALLLKYFHDMKIKEIGRVTGANQSTVKSRLKQGLSKLEGILKRGERNGQENIRW